MDNRLKLTEFSWCDYIRTKDEFEAFILEIQRIERERCSAACMDETAPYGGRGDSINRWGKTK